MKLAPRRWLQPILFSIVLGAVVHSAFGQPPYLQVQPRLIASAGNSAEPGKPVYGTRIEGGLLIPTQHNTFRAIAVYHAFVQVAGVYRQRIGYAIRAPAHASG